jgi:hypothetical protein
MGQMSLMMIHESISDDSSSSSGVVVVVVVAVIAIHFNIRINNIDVPHPLVGSNINYRIR